MSDLDSAKKDLRAYLNKALQGKNVDALLESAATGVDYLNSNIEAVNDSLYIVKAQGRFLDALLADRNLTRPDNVGLSDEIYRELGIEVTNRKQVRDLLLNILRIVYGEEYTRATMSATELEPYALEDGDTLIIQYDDEESVEVIFKSSQFTNISAATAQEVADAITKEIRRLGKRGSATVNDDGGGAYPTLISDTDGPASSIKVYGGKAQNVLKFPTIKPVAGNATTQWTLSLGDAGAIRATWTGGTNPSIGKASVGDYVTIYGSAFDELNQGTFTLTAVQGGLINDAYVEFENPTGLPETVIQGSDDAILFYAPTRSIISSKVNYSSVYQTESRVLEIFMPATTKIVRRDRVGSAHVHESGTSGDGNEGPYIYDTSKPYIISETATEVATEVDGSTFRVVEVSDSSQFPDESGYLIFGFGTELEEGPVPYTARPSSGNLLIDPSYNFKNTHVVGTDISLVAQNAPYDPAQDGSDYQFYITDIVSGRLYAEELINTVAATGISVIIYILYPSDIGLAKFGTDNSDKYYVWGDDY